MNESDKMYVVTSFLEGMYYVGKHPSLAEVGDITAYLRRKGMVDGTQTQVERLVHIRIEALTRIWDTPNKPVVSACSIQRTDGLNRKIFGRTAHVYWQERLVVRVLALEDDMIRLFFDETNATDPHRYTDVPYTEQLRITR